MEDSERYEDAETIISCPYDKSHAFPRKSLLLHLTKCHKGDEVNNPLQKCHYNYTHRIPLAELDKHLTICPDRELFFGHMYRTENNQNSSRAADNRNAELNELHKNTRDTVDSSSTENWDNEVDESGYKRLDEIEKTAKQRNVLKCYSNLQPAIRKQRQQEQVIETKKRSKAKEDNERMASMNQNFRDDSSPGSSSRTGVTIPSGSSFSLAQNAVENSLNSLSNLALSPGSTTGRGRGKKSTAKNSVEKSYERGKR